MSKIHINPNRDSNITRTSINALELDRLYVCEQAFIYMITEGMPESFVVQCQNLITQLILFQKDEITLKALIKEADINILPSGKILLDALRSEKAEK